jgi:hypothetical protein
MGFAAWAPTVHQKYIHVTGTIVESFDDPGNDVKLDLQTKWSVEPELLYIVGPTPVSLEDEPQEIIRVTNKENKSGVIIELSIGGGIVVIPCVIALRIW